MKRAATCGTRIQTEGEVAKLSSEINPRRADQEPT